MTLSVVHAVSSPAFAGVERHIAALAAVQAASGMRVGVVGGDPDRMLAALHGAPVSFHEGANVPGVVRALGRFRGAQILHVHMTAAETAGLLTLGLAQVPMIATRHFAARRGKSLPGRLVSVAIRRRLAAQIAISDYVAGRIDGSSTVIHPGVPEAHLVPAERRRPAALIAQRLEPEKGTDLALQAFAASGLASKGWVLQVAGDGSQRFKLEALASELGIASQTVFLGMRDDVDRLLAEAAVLLAPCEIEGLGLTVLEAMACGLPVVAAAAGGHLETVGAVRGAALYPPGNVREAGAQLAELAKDADRRADYGASLHELQRSRFTMGSQVAATEAIYRSVL